MRPAAFRPVVLAALVGGAACVDVPQDFVRPRVGSVTLVGGANQVTQVGSDAVPPQLRVLGPDSLPIAGLEVRYTAVGAGSSVSPAVVRTDSLGIAQPGAWTVSSIVGQDTLLAVVVGVGTYTFTATVTPPCVGATTLVAGDSVNGQVNNAGCLTSGGRRATAYQLTGPTPTLPYGALLRMTGASYRGRVDLQVNGVPLATSAFDTATNNTATILAFLPPTTVTLLAQADVAGSTGNFTLATRPNPTYVGCMDNAFLVPGGSTSQTIDSDACPFLDSNGSTYYAHTYRVRLATRQRIVIRMNSVAINCFLLVLDPSGQTVLSQDDVGTVNSVALEFTAPRTGYYLIAALSTLTPRSTGGPYAISVDP
jgi:hypothetical protein